MSRLLWSSVVVAVLVGAAAFANSSGIVAQNCNACHTGGTAPVVTVTPSATNVTAGSTTPITLTVTVQGGATTQTHGGFSLTATGGTLSATGANTKKLGTSITHTGPVQQGAANTVTFTASWTPPATGGTVTFTAFGNKVNNDGFSSGDRSSSNTATVTVTATCTPVTETCNGLDDDCDGQLDNGATCPANQTCTAGACVAVDAGSGGGAGGGAGGGSGGGTGGGGGGSSADAGTGPGTDDGAGCGCTSVHGGMLGLIGLALTLVRARRRRE